MENITVMQWVFIVLSIFGILGILISGLVIFSRFGKRVLAKLQSHEDIFTEFMRHVKLDSETIRQEVFRHRGKLEQQSRTIKQHSDYINKMEKRHVEQDH